VSEAPPSELQQRVLDSHGWMPDHWSSAMRRLFLAGRLCASCLGEATADRWGGFVIRHRMPCPRSVVVRNGRVEVGAFGEYGSAEPSKTPEESAPEPSSRA
jgi:hypothetical protein